jgi:protein TonB
VSIPREASFVVVRGETAGQEPIFASLVLSSPRAKDRGFKAFPLSLTLHGAALLALAALRVLALQNLPPAVRFGLPPIVGIPGEPGPPPPKGQPKAAPAQKATQNEVKAAILADDLVVTAEPARLEETALAGPDSPGEGSGPKGDPNGVDGGSGNLPGAGAGDGRGDCPTCTEVVNAPDEKARLLSQVNPVYPPAAFIKKVEGMVVIEAVIDATGHVLQPRVVLSNPLLDQAALECVQKWLFAPAKRHESPVSSRARLQVTFRIL